MKTPGNTQYSRSANSNHVLVGREDGNEAAVDENEAIIAGIVLVHILSKLLIRFRMVRVDALDAMCQQYRTTLSHAYVYCQWCVLGWQCRGAAMSTNVMLLERCDSFVSRRQVKALCWFFGTMEISEEDYKCNYTSETRVSSFVSVVSMSNAPSGADNGMRRLWKKMLECFCALLRSQQLKWAPAVV